MHAKRRANLGWNAWVLLTFVGGVLLIAGCGADPGAGSALNDLLGVLGVTAGATDAKAPAQGQGDESSDPEDGDTQTGEFEGEHQFGADDGVEDGTNDDEEDDDDQQGEFEGEHQYGDDNDDGDGDEDEDGENNEDEQEAEGNELKGVLSGDGVTVIVEYEQEADHTSFEVEVTGGQPDATLDVTVNGVVVLSIALDASGAGEFEFSSAPDDPGADEQQLPAEFPVLSAGDVVAVGQLSGPLEAEEDD